jgi:uncharacterized protein YjfI (DUF2170 family)
MRNVAIPLSRSIVPKVKLSIIGIQSQDIYLIAGTLNSKAAITTFQLFTSLEEAAPLSF